MSDLNTRPATKLRAISASDETEVNCRALYVGSGGNVAIIAADDDEATVLPAIGGGQVLPISCKKVMSTGTTASGFVALF